MSESHTENADTPLTASFEDIDALNWLHRLHSRIDYFLSTYTEYDQLFTTLEQTHPVLARQTIRQLNNEFQSLKTTLSDRPPEFPQGLRPLVAAETSTTDHINTQLDDLQTALDDAHALFQNHVLPNLPADDDTEFDERVVAFSGKTSHPDVTGIPSSNVRNEASNVQMLIEDYFHTHGFSDYPDSTRHDSEPNPESRDESIGSSTKDAQGTSQKPTTQPEPDHRSGSGSEADGRGGRVNSKPPAGSTITNVAPVEWENGFPDCDLPSCDSEAKAVVSWEKDGVSDQFKCCMSHTPSRARQVLKDSTLCKRGALHDDEYVARLQAVSWPDFESLKWRESHYSGEQSTENILAEVEYTVTSGNKLKIQATDYMADETRRKKRVVDIDEFDGCIPLINHKDIKQFLSREFRNNVKQITEGGEPWNHLVPAYEDLDSAHRAIQRMQKDGGQNPEDYWPLCADCSVVVGGTMEDPEPCEKCGGMNIIPVSECDERSDVVEIDESIKMR